MQRASGILMPIFALPNNYGIGSFGKESYKFVDFLKESKQKVWQILPLVQTGFGDSPYSSVCSTSFNPYFISPELLRKQGLITAEELRAVKIKSEYIDYAKIYSLRFDLLRKAFIRFDQENEEFKNFVNSKEFYYYSLYMAIKIVTNYKPLNEWEDGLKYRNPKAIREFEKANKNEIAFWQFVQFTAKTQWHDLKEYANRNGIQILGDMPLYVALDSVDVWENPSLFKLDENFLPKKVAGVPPDYFSKTGQLWGNPVYDYDTHKKDNFKWWKSRLKKALNTFDMVRIDHFRGLDRYYEIDSSAVDATQGNWVEVPSKELFDSVKKTLGSGRIIAEDLGIIDDGVRELLAYTGYPGMKILSFAFDGQGDNLYLPENVNENSICYTGTHDNDTLVGLLNNLSDWDYNNFYWGVKNSLKKLKIKCSVENKKGIKRAIIKLGFACKSKLFILPMQDLVGYGSEMRINEPGTVKEQNWSIRFRNKDFYKAKRERLLKLTEKYQRS